MFTASTGGHLTELVELSHRVPHDPSSVWVTFDTIHSQHLLDGKNVEYVTKVGQRDIYGCLKSIQTARSLLRRYRPDRIFSTGAAIAGVYLPLGRMFGAKSYYIESAARFTGPSLTGSILAKTPGVSTYSQTATWPKWQKIPSVFSGFHAEQAIHSSRDPKKILVTVGTQRHYSFRRLFDRLAKILPDSCEVLWQVGNKEGLDLPGRVVEKLSPIDLQSEVEEADLVISHAGIGSTLMALQAGKSPVVVPRRASFNEHVDDHQLEILEALGTTDLATFREVEDIVFDDLRNAANTRITPAPKKETLQL